MTIRIIAAFFALAVVFALVSPVAAQNLCGASSSPCLQVLLLNWWDIAPGPNWDCWIPPACNFEFGCYCCQQRTFSASSSCSSPAADQETGCGCGKSCAGSPVNLANGNTYIMQTDMTIPGLGNGLALARTWNSRWPATQSGSALGIFGLNWRSSYEERVFMGSDGSIKYSRADGSFWSFGYNGTTGQWLVLAPANGGATLASGSNYWTLSVNNGEQRLFANSSGSLTSVVDRNGNTTQLSYDGLNRLVTVTDPGSRHLYFGYNNANYPYQATSVTSDFGVTLSYAYDQQGRLITVTKPDNTTISFVYNAQSLITAVKDSDGKILESHTYDSIGRGLTSSRVGGIDAVTVSYSQ